MEFDEKQLADILGRRMYELMPEFDPDEQALKIMKTKCLVLTRSQFEGFMKALRETMKEYIEGVDLEEEE